MNNKAEHLTSKYFKLNIFGTSVVDLVFNFSEIRFVRFLVAGQKSVLI